MSGKRKLDDITKGDGGLEDVSDDDVAVEEEELPNGRRKCPFLDTINRQALDFDSEKLCSVTLTNMNVYVCLVCGKYFQGRGKGTPAYTHSVQDAQKCLSPKYTLQDLAALSSSASLARDVHGVSYLPGFVGLNNLNCTDYVNALLHALAHVKPFRDYWLQERNYEMAKGSLVHLFGLTLRKMWSSNNFKSTVSPQEFVQALSVESKRRFGIGQRAECLDLLVWLLGTLHRGLGKAAVGPAMAEAGNGGKDSGGRQQELQARSVVYEPFQGIIEVTSLTKRLVSSAAELQGQEHAEGEWVRSVTQVPFSHLSVDIPPCPLFRDSEGGLVIPQVPLFQLLQKFDGSTWTDTMTSEAHVRRQYRILRLPRYLVLHLVRFTRNNFYLEKNPTIVTFPVRNLELKDFLHRAEGGLGAKRAVEEEALRGACPSASELPEMSAAQLRQVVLRLGSELHRLQLLSILPERGGSISGGAVEMSAAQKADLLAVASAAVERAQLFGATKYDLLANICHSGDPSSQSAKGGVAVGDLNMMMGQPSGTGGKSKAKSAGSGAVAGSGAAGAVNAGAGAAAAAQAAVGSAVYISATATAANNRVLNEGSYRVHLQHKGTGQWFEIQDLHVHEISPQLIGVSESNILIYEKKPVKHE